MKLTLAISLVAHVMVLVLLGARRPSTPNAIVAMTIFDRAAPPRAEPAPHPERQLERPVAVHASERAPRPHLRRVARALPPAPPPMPTVREPEPAPAPSPEPADAPAETTTEGEAPPMELPPPAPARPSLARDPDLEPGSCVRGLQHPAPGRVRGEVIVRLRLALDDKGQVSQVAVVEPAGDGFDDIAVRAVREKCRFSAALDDRGRPVPFVIDEFRFRFPPPGIGIFHLQ